MVKFPSTSFQVFLLSLGCFFSSPLLTKASYAQVTPDNTVNTQVNQNGNVSEITGGETRGNNLFHSFQDFSIPTGNEAFFNNNNAIANIFSRVTGGNISNIDGLIRANGNASLFLINPAGIIFGENARLDIGGSFYGSTASSILFDDGEFSAADNLDQPILTVNAPIGLGFRDNPGEIINNSITNNGRGLEVASGNTISLLGGDIRFNGGRVTAPQGIVNLGGLSAPGEITIEDNNFTLPEGVERANIAFVDNAIADIGGDGGGRIEIATNNLTLTGESLLLASIPEDMGEEDGVAGTIELNTNNISADGASLIQADNLGTGKAGTININTNILNFTNGSAITATTFGKGDAGDINLIAREITIDREFSGIYSNVGLTNVASESLELDTAGVVGNGGIINIDTENLTLLNGARIISTSIAQGDGGTVNINATGTVLYQGVGETPIPVFGGGTVISGSFSQVQQEGVGNAGEVNINANSLSLLDTGAILVDHSGLEGNAGDINLNIGNNLTLDRTGLILAQIQSGTVGNGGDINITANSLLAANNSQILADTRGMGNAGNIDLEITETLSLDNTSLILAAVQPGGVGNGGNINVDARNIFLNNGSGIEGLTRGRGNGGDVTLMVQETISLDNNSAIASLVDNLELEDGTTANPTGNGGNITITTGELNVLNGSEIIADTSGLLSPEGNLSNAGAININVTGDINLSNSSQIQSQTRSGGVGNAGDITINAGGSLFSRGGNFILADTQATGNGGNIKINVAETILLEGNLDFPSQIVAGLTRETSQGMGGIIEITAGELVMEDVAFISSNTVENSIGSAGNIILKVGKLNLSENAFINVLTANNFDGGSISIEADAVDFTRGGKILAATDGTGNAGNISFNVSNLISIDNSVESTANFVDFGENVQLLNDLQSEPSGIYADAAEDATGNGGNVDVISQNLLLDSNARISAATESGQGGVINLNIANILSLNNNSLISAEAFNDADGGNLNINSKFIIAFPNGNNDIIATAERGNGGNININAESLFGIQQRQLSDFSNDINASSEFSLDGTVTISTPDINSLQGEVNLPTNIIETEETTAQACQNNREATANNSFTISGKGGIPDEPGLPQDSHNISIADESDTTSTIPAPIQTSKGKIQPARGIKVTESGNIILTAYHTNNAGERMPKTRHCR